MPTLTMFRTASFFNPRPPLASFNVITASDAIGGWSDVIHLHSMVWHHLARPLNVSQRQVYAYFTLPRRAAARTSDTLSSPHNLCTRPATSTSGPGNDRGRRARFRLPGHSRSGRPILALSTQFSLVPSRPILPRLYPLQDKPALQHPALRPTPKPSHRPSPHSPPPALNQARPHLRTPISDDLAHSINPKSNPTHSAAPHPHPRPAQPLPPRPFFRSTKKKPAPQFFPLAPSPPTRRHFKLGPRIGSGRYLRAACRIGTLGTALFRAHT
ncbi:hypothetical protein HETIRDRAFT_453418 [Heterobasidion irregulare TC 32-1]|uniref:Uncharacterized protein n=1 Tax=Heterobasidion irregulare (strain TC 32-1) TaxID=747525 RepID=W4JZ84_HETIT|nr:uncharacterized protein HETIRDRAFT_453418 [Heterobasidion irregulare TC 32-1]ETW78852.1 hypothetical protein HETIRDRAFT_453418 [Heterobasidion irregulare TC 32-1]